MRSKALYLLAFGIVCWVGGMTTMVLIDNNRPVQIKPVVMADQTLSRSNAAEWADLPDLPDCTAGLKINQTANGSNSSNIVGHGNVVVNGEAKKP